MYGIINFEAFVLAGVLLNLTPGVDSVYILSRSILHGRAAGVYSALGIVTGAFCHVLFATLGLSIILTNSNFVFEIIKYLGAIYLVYLGVKAMFTKNSGEYEWIEDSPEISHRRIYISGILTNIFNPKMALFFLAFLPQFIDPSYINSSLSFFILGAVFLATGTIWCLVLAVLASRVSAGFRGSQGVKKWLNKITGSVFILLGIKLAMVER